MKVIFNHWRSLLNLVGIFFTFLVICLGFASIVLLAAGDSYHGKILFIVSFLLNYLITICLAVELINSTKKSDLYITFNFFIFLLLPGIGIFLYFLLGFDSLHLGNVDRYSKIYERYKKYERKVATPVKLGALESLACKTFSYNEIKYKAPVYDNVNLSLLSTSIETLREMTDLIERAKHFIHMEFYMFCDGMVFDHILNLLSKKVKQGVEIRLITDYIGNSGRLSTKSRKKIIDAGIQLRIFNPLFGFDSLWWQFRNHNKILIVDNEYALCGSCNIADEYFNITSKYFQTTEITVKMSGTIVNSLTSLFFAHWDLCRGAKFQNIPKRKKDWDLTVLDVLSYFRSYKNGLIKNETRAQFLDNSPISNELIIKDNLVQLIFNAKKKIIISTPYFFPPNDLVNALKQASISGVSIKILVPKHPDLINFFRTLNRQLFAVLLQQNVEIYEYFGFNHEKLLIIDDETVYFGSYNWDYRALYLNFENALLVRCKNLTSSMCKFMDQQFKNSHKILYEDLKTSRGFISICFSSFIRIFKPFL